MDFIECQEFRAKAGAVFKGEDEKLEGYGSVIDSQGGDLAKATELF